MMWTVGAHELLAADFAVVCFLDRSVDPKRITARLQRTAAIVPQLRHRVVESHFSHRAPRWEPATDFSAANHVETERLPSGSGRQDVLDRAKAMMRIPLDRSMPLWKIHIIDYDDGCALIQRYHHVITDGEGGLRMAEHLVDLERDALDPAPIALPDLGSTRHDPFGAVAEQVRAASELIGSSAALGLKVATTIVDSGTRFLREPTSIGDVGAEVVSSGAAALSTLGVGEHSLAPLWTERSTSHSLRSVSVSLADLRAAAHVCDASINDAFVAAAVRASAAYHRALGRDLPAIRVAMPVSTRSTHSAGGNAFGLTRSTLTASGEPSAHLRALHDELSVAKAAPTVGLTELLAASAARLPAPLLQSQARRIASTIDLTVSNVRGSRFALYMAGAKMLDSVPIGPLAGTAVNMTALSAEGKLVIGIVSDDAAVSDPDLLCSSMSEALAELLLLVPVAA